MKRRDWLYALALVALPALLCAQDAVRDKPPAPRALLEEPERDLGVRAVGDPVAAEFRVRNAGGAALELQSVKAPLGIVVEGVPGTVAAGASQTIRVSLSAPPPGPLVIEAFIRTNDPERTELRLVLRATVQAFLLIHPGYARYIVVQQAADGTINQTIGAADAASFRVLKVESPHTSLRASFREARPEERRPGWQGSQWRIEATLLRDAPVGALTGAIVVVTDHPRQRVVRAPVSGFVRPIFAVTPPEARLGDVDPRRAARVRLVVKNYAEERIELRGVESNVSGVRAELEAREPGRSWRLTLWMDPDKPLGAFEGRVRILTASPKVPAFDVPLSGRVVRSPASPAAVR